MDTTQQTLHNIITHMKNLEDTIKDLQDKMKDSIIPIQFKNYYYNHPNTTRNINSDSKLFIDSHTELGLNVMNRVMIDINDTSLYFTEKQTSMKLFNDMEHITHDMHDFIANEHNMKIVVPSNKIIKVWYNPQHMNNNNIASVFYEGTYDPSILRYGMVIWMGTIENMDCLPDML